MLLKIYFFLLVSGAYTFIHPITIYGRYFVDSETKEPFYIKGVDYQPGGSSGVTSDSDPLSDPVICARDIALFQDLGINTIRIYSVNTNLNHDACMTILASAGIYLVLDVNSPLPNHHLNRYEPWVTYTKEYLKNVYEVVHQFSGYNNTLGFFAGNEVVNDKLSATNSPVYIKALVRDIKNYIEHHSQRPIPVGYSAADDLSYRVSLSEYLQCVDHDLSDTVDFYGVNSYQWCGEQTMQTSGYDKLVEAYADFSRPVFFSEYGCNEVTPRNFDEVHALYSKDMTNVFNGGLIYEFSQEPNNYGLVEILPTKDIRLLADYFSLKQQFESLPELDYRHVLKGMKDNINNIQDKLRTRPHALPECANSYDNLDISRGLPDPVGSAYLTTGVRVEQGKYATITESEFKSPYKVFDVDGSSIYINEPTVQLVEDTTSSWSSSRRNLRGFQNCTYYDLLGDSSEFGSFSDDENEGDSKKSENFILSIFNKVSKAFVNLKQALT